MSGRKAGQQATQWEIHFPFHSEDAAGKRQDCKRACGYGEGSLHTEDDCVAALKMWALLGCAAQTRIVGVHARKRLEHNLRKREEHIAGSSNVPLSHPAALFLCPFGLLCCFVLLHVCR